MLSYNFGQMYTISNRIFKQTLDSRILTNYKNAQNEKPIRIDLDREQYTFHRNHSAPSIEPIHINASKMTACPNMYW